MKCFAHGIWLMLSVVATCFATAPDLNDAVLVMYKLSPTEEAQFNAHDGAVSAFWSKWDMANASALTKDYIFMASDDVKYAWNHDSAKTFIGHDDAQLQVRAAYTDKGAYFYCAVTDNIWTPHSNWGTDVIDFFIDNVPQASVADPVNWFNPTQWALTSNSRELLVPMGGSSISTFGFIRYNDQALSVVGTLPPTVDDPTLDKMTMELVIRDGMHRVSEWFIPWTQWGLTAPPPMGATLAFTCEYNDADSSVAGIRTLEWIGLCNPYCMPPNAATWGEVEIGPDYDGCACGDWPPYQPKVINKIREPRPASGVMHSEMYTLRGDRIVGAGATGLVIQRQIGKNGVRSSAMALGM